MFVVLSHALAVKLFALTAQLILYVDTGGESCDFEIQS